MTTTVGQGEFRFVPQESWARLPADLALGEVAGIAVDHDDRVYLFNRGPHPVVVLERDGTFVATWGAGVFTNPHGAALGPDGTILLTDNGDHTVRRFTLDGEPLLEIGIPGQPSPFLSGTPFHRCTHSAVGPGGEIYVSDGYGNARVHVFSTDGRLVGGWGEPGARHGQFNLPHNIACDERGRVYVADRENHRVQIFAADGTYLSSVTSVHRPSGMTLTGGPDPLVLVGELAPYLPVNHDSHHLGPRVTVVRADGTVVSTLAAEPSRGTGPGQFLSPHALALDSHGDLYVGDVGVTDWADLFPGTPRPDRIRPFQKLARVRTGA
ncbi:peptidyl-alpha-hydroxyglycine alpha-amidating lyase family protein [Streptomyces hainanensis]|uniref:Peptidylamidoglycolate lyase n=1 Tax=Streptomyces hainanensis TaxID=402648 RepID=A0A4R4TNV6_9ACTN|nr:peptidyl-alpha-hydroxyglycine alpha-amidating lyase family protein [Streptomyces hainanensis]TDC79570.1 hypothetical protein E1283_02475 [Streptomyces hainanensis]